MPRVANHEAGILWNNAGSVIHEQDGKIGVCGFKMQVNGVRHQSPAT